MNTFVSNKKAAINGALIAVAGVFAYSLMVIMYTIIRSSVSIITIMPSSQQNTILLANGFSIAYSVAMFSALMAVVSAIAGAVAAVILTKVLLHFNPQLLSNRAIFVGSVTALALLLMLYLLLRVLFKERITPEYVETFLFWYAYPAIIFFIAVVISAVKLNKYLVKRKNE